MHNKKIVFSDLDGTMIDHENYSYQEAKNALERIIEMKVPLILVSSKTYAEIEALRNQLKKDSLEINSPFIIENGSAIYVPKNYFNFDIKDSLPDYTIGEKRGYDVINISQVNYADLVKQLKDIEKENDFKIVGFNDLSAEELSKECGLSIEQSQLAKTREFDEPFRIVPDDQESYKKVEESIKKKGLNYTKGGRYAHIMGRQDKGLAVQILDKLYKKQFGKIESIGLGDSKNDLEFLEYCDQGYLVSNPKKPVDASVESEKIHKVGKIGPAGFNEVILEYLKD